MTCEDHHDNLDKCLTRLRNGGFTLSKSKYLLLRNTLEFFGKILSAEGIRPDSKRVTNLLSIPIPKAIHDVFWEW